MWRRRKWLAVLAFAAPFAAAVSLIAAMPDLYRARATILVLQEQGADPAVGPAAAGELEARLQLINEQILSRARLEELIERFDLYPVLRKKRVSSDVLVERMRRDIRFERRQAELRGGGVTVAFTLGYQSWDPEVTARVANALADFYVQENEKLRRRAPGVPPSVDMLAQLQQELMELRTRYNENYPDIVQLKAEIAALQRLRQQEAARAGAEPGAQSSRPAHHPAMAGMPDGEGGAENREQFIVLDSAIPPMLPAAPNRLRLLFMALVFALAISGASVLLAEHLDTSFHRRDDLWGFTNMPILASIPRIVTRTDIWLRRLRRGLVGVMTLAGLALLIRAGWFLGRHGDQLVWMLAQRGS